jgi:hypothetical protein
MGYTNLTTTIAEGKIANALKSTAADHVVAKAENIYDTGLKGYQSEINENFTNKFNDYLSLAGGTMTGDLTIKRNSSDSPSIILQRAETNDTFEDWRMSNVGGYFKIQNRNSGNTWVDVLSLAPSNTKTLTSSYSVLPSANDTLTLGNSTYKWKDIYATNFLGKATTASSLDGNIATSVNSCHGDKILKYYTLSGCTATEATGNKRYAGTADSYGFPVSNNANGLLWLGNHSTNYGHQLGFSSDGNIYHRKIDNGSFPTIVNGGSWKQILAGIASSTNLGGIKIGYTQSGKNYPVQLDSNNKAYVNVPWTDTDTNTDTKVTQTVTTANANYPLLLAPADQTATATTTSYFDSGVTLNPSTNILDGAKVYESLLQWGNTAIQNDMSPIDAAMLSEISNNKLAFMPGNLINIEFSRDAGTSWYTYPDSITETQDSIPDEYTFISDNAKRSLVTDGFGTVLYLGARKDVQQKDDQLRITITGDGSNIFFKLKKILVYYCQAYGTGNYCRVEGAYANDPETFTELGEYTVTGWSGWNSIPCVELMGEYANSNRSTNIRHLRLIFGITGVTSTTATSIYVSKLRMLGTVSYGALPQFAASGHLYKYDINQNATFPANLTSTGSLTVKGNTILGDATTDTITIKGKTIIEEGAGLVIKGTGSVNHIMARGVRGSDGNGNVGSLYLQYGANKPVYFGDGGSYHISADGSQYSGNALTATDIKSGNIATAAEITALFN